MKSTMLDCSSSIDNSAVQIPTVHIPLGCSLHIKPVVDGEFLAFEHLKASGDGRYESIARMFCVRPLAVCDEAVVELVCQGRGVVLGGVELGREIHVVSSLSASFCPFYKDCVASVAVWCPLLLRHSDPIVEGYQRPCRLVKIDTQTSKVESWSEENCYCSEPVYISEPEEAREDSGLLICSLLWGKPSVNTTAILILSARDLSPVARVSFMLPGPVPKPLHGSF